MRYIKLITFLAAIAAIGACSGDDDMQGTETDVVIPSIEAVQARFGSLPLQQ